jgi:hypothetical protein
MKKACKSSNLYAIIAEGVSEQLLEAIPVEELLDQHFACVMFRHTDALSTINQPSGIGE